MKCVMEKVTNNPIKAFLLGLCVTAIVCSIGAKTDARRVGIEKALDLLETFDENGSTPSGTRTSTAATMKSTGSTSGFWMPFV